MMRNRGYFCGQDKIIKFIKIKDRYFLSILVILLAFYWLLFHYPSLNYYWSSDDLHLVRQFSKTEIIQVFSSTWDVDKIETPGFRPFTLLFNHFRFILIGESPANHRLFILSLMTGLLWMIGWISIKLGLQRGIVAFALLILVSTKSLTGDIVWIADGIHIFQHCLIAISIIFMILFIDYQSLWSGFLSLIFVWIALWTREDSLILLFLMPVIFTVYYCQGYGLNKLKEIFLYKRKFLVFFIFLYCIAGVTFLYRSYVVTGTPEIGSIMGFLNHVKWSVWIVGDYIPEIMSLSPEWGVQTGGRLLALMTLLWGVLIAALTVFFLLVARINVKKQVSICLLGLFLTSTPGLYFSRSNLLFMPTMFFSLALAISMFEILNFRFGSDQACGFSRTNKSCDRVLHLLFVLICILAVGGSLYRSIIQRLDMHPFSINQVISDYDALYGEYAEAIVPIERRTYLIEKLSRVGIDARSKSDINIIFLELYYKAKIIELWSVFSADNTKSVFIPIVAFLHP
jgi:hypothetical protein